MVQFFFLKKIWVLANKIAAHRHGLTGLENGLFEESVFLTGSTAGLTGLYMGSKPPTQNKDWLGIWNEFRIFLFDLNCAW